MSKAPTQRGSMAVEAAIIAPAFILALFFALALARVGSAQLEVRNAAHQAARAATLERDPGAATAAARAAGYHSIEVSGLVCAGGGTVDPNVGTMAPGGQVSVTVTCDVSFSDLGMGFGGSQTMDATAVEVIEEKRAIP